MIKKVKLLKKINKLKKFFKVIRHNTIFLKDLE